MKWKRWTLSAVGGWALISLSFLASASEPRAPDSLAVVKKNIEDKKGILVDVREPAEWKEGHIAGAISIPLIDLDDDAKAAALKQKLPKDQILYTYCVVGVRARTAAEWLRKDGFDVRPLKAGYKDLLKAGFKKAEPQPSHP